MNKYCYRTIEKYLNRKLKENEVIIYDIDSNLIIKEWKIPDKTEPTESELQALFTSKEKEIYQDICIKELNNIYLGKFVQEIFDTWKSNNKEYQDKLKKIMDSNKAKLKDKVESKVEL